MFCAVLFLLQFCGCGSSGAVELISLIRSFAEHLLAYDDKLGKFGGVSQDDARVHNRKRCMPYRHTQRNPSMLLHSREPVC